MVIMKGLKLVLLFILTISLTVLPVSPAAAVELANDVHSTPIDPSELQEFVSQSFWTGSGSGQKNDGLRFYSGNDGTQRIDVGNFPMYLFDWVASKALWTSEGKFISSVTGVMGSLSFTPDQNTPNVWAFMFSISYFEVNSISSTRDSGFGTHVLPLANVPTFGQQLYPLTGYYASAWKAKYTPSNITNPTHELGYVYAETGAAPLFRYDLWGSFYVYNTSPSYGSSGIAASYCSTDLNLLSAAPLSPDYYTWNPESPKAIVRYEDTLGSGFLVYCYKRPVDAMSPVVDSEACHPKGDRRSSVHLLVSDNSATIAGGSLSIGFDFAWRQSGFMQFSYAMRQQALLDGLADILPDLSGGEKAAEISLEITKIEEVHDGLVDSGAQAAADLGNQLDSQKSILDSSGISSEAFNLSALWDLIPLWVYALLSALIIFMTIKRVMG